MRRRGFLKLLTGAVIAPIAARVAARFSVPAVKDDPAWPHENSLQRAMTTLDRYWESVRAEHALREEFTNLENT